jgi:hypothetical protein
VSRCENCGDGDCEAGWGRKETIACRDREIANLRAELAAKDYRGALGLVRVVREAGGIVHYRALGPRQQLPKGNFLTLYRSCQPLEAEESE